MTADLSRTMARVASSCPLRQWWISIRMRLLACETVRASSNRPWSRSMRVRPDNLTASARSPSPSQGTGPRSSTYQ